MKHEVKLEIDIDDQNPEYINSDHIVQLSNAEEDSSQATIITYECYICASRCNDQSILQSHMIADHGFKFRGKRRNECRRRSGRKKPRRKVHCEVCGLLMCTSAKSRHIRLVHMKNDLHYCSFCGAHYQTLPLLVEHVKTEHLSNNLVNTTATFQYPCHVCKKYFKNQTNVDRHMKYIHATINEGGPDKLTCIDCRKVFKNKFGLMRHVECSHFGKISKENQETPCDVCGKMFANLANKRRHIRIIHEGVKAFRCQVCGKCFGQATELADHMDRSHNGNCVYTCDECQKTFNAKSCLKVHYARFHSTNPNKYQKKRDKIIRICEICGRSMEYGALYAHMRSHLGIKSFECGVCSKKFVHKSNLVLHSRIHTKERPFKCEFCPRTFRQYGHVREHRKTHTGEKPYTCLHCGKAFAGLSNMREHERIHTGETPYHCNLCADRFRNLKALRRHAKSLHPDEEDKAVTVKPKQYTAERWKL